uniref:Uncharacterized protein n=1 Tax=Mycena chlorophos TaxID=658473 RepID=A0ABQ0LGD3_MYCCL|nr:predicted protein [Mycena chlorophos]
MDETEISLRATTITSASPPFPEVYRGALFPAGGCGKPTIVPVPLDYGLDMYMFPDDLCTQTWVGSQSASTPGRCKQWRIDITGAEAEKGSGSVYLAWGFAQKKITMVMGGQVNAGLSDQSRTVYGDVLIMKESGDSEAGECIVDLDEGDLKHVCDRFRK